MESKNRKLDKQLTILIKKNAEIRKDKESNDASKETLKVELQLLTREFEKIKKAVDED
jgi:hypothetical protein